MYLDQIERIRLLYFLSNANCIKIKILFSSNQNRSKFVNLVLTIKRVIKKTIENQSILLSDHELRVDGVIYRELKSLNQVVIQYGPDAGKEEQVFFYDRSIGGQRHSFGENDSEGSDNKEIEVKAFQEAWNKNWNPKECICLFNNQSNAAVADPAGFWKPLSVWHLRISDLNFATVSLPIFTFSLRSDISDWTFFLASATATKFLLRRSSKSVVCLYADNVIGLVVVNKVCMYWVGSCKKKLERKLKALSRTGSRL